MKEFGHDQIISDHPIPLVRKDRNQQKYCVYWNFSVIQFRRLPNLKYELFPSHRNDQGLLVHINQTNKAVLIRWSLHYNKLIIYIRTLVSRPHFRPLLLPLKILRCNWPDTLLNLLELTFLTSFLWISCLGNICVLESHFLSQVCEHFHTGLHNYCFLLHETIFFAFPENYSRIGSIIDLLV